MQRAPLLYRYLRKAKEHLLISQSYLEGLEDAEHVGLEWPTAVPKPVVGLVKDFRDELSNPPWVYWPKYERYLAYNRIPYHFLDVYRSDWLSQARQFDMIVWRTMSDPATQHEAETKIYILENLLQKTVLPTFKEVWSYEDKIRQHYLFRLFDIPSVSTFVSHCRSEALDFADMATYPLVSKISTGSGSQGVELIHSRKQGRKLINTVFGPGRRTYWGHLRQKDYVYFQTFIPDAMYDLRIIVVGNKYFGYYRNRRPNDFRASGSGLYEKKAIPTEALSLARIVKQKLGGTILAVDMIKSEAIGSYLVIEASIFIQVDTAQQLKVNGIPGYYYYDGSQFVFAPGKYWIQELALNEVIQLWIESKLYAERHTGQVRDNTLGER